MRTQPDPRTNLTAQPTPSILTDITIDHGPAELLAPLFLRAENALREMGVHLSFGTLEELAAVNTANRATWLPLFPIYQPAYWPNGQGESFCLLGRDAAGQVIYTIAVRIFDWPRTTYHDEATSLRLFYGDVERFRRPKERCEVTAQATRKVTGRVGVGGAIWVHPDWRGNKRLIPLGGQIARCYSIARWNIDYYVGMVTESVSKGGMSSKVRVPNIDWSIDMLDCLYGDMRLAFLWLNRSELHDDLSRLLVDLGSKVDVGLRLHDAEQRPAT